MNYEMAQYIEVNTIALVMLVTMWYYVVGTHRVNETKKRQIFIKMLVTNGVILLSDIGIYLLRGRSASHWILITHVLCVVFFLMHGCFGYFWMQYSLQCLCPDYQPSKQLTVLLWAPQVLSSAIIIASPWTGWVYQISEENRYHRGPYMWVVMTLACVYWAASVVLTVAEKINPKQIREASVYCALLIFPLPTFIGNLLQLRFYGMSIVWVCSAISLLILFINLQNNQLSRDMLTGLFNRRQTNMQLAWEMEHLPDSGYQLFLAMVDVDHFKNINDQCGHLAGDQAIIQVGKILRGSCRKKDFIGRFGGDEFVIIGHTTEAGDWQAIKETIQQKTAEVNAQQGLPYWISLSVGVTIYSRQDELTVDAMLSAADQAMYRVKAQRHLTEKTTAIKH